MTFEEFIHSLVASSPDPSMPPLLQALWYDGKGNWEKSHHIAQDVHSKEAARIHAYLHRKEGDIWNADYWYRMAGALRPDISHDEEWSQLVKERLGITNVE